MSIYRTEQEHSIQRAEPDHLHSGPGPWDHLTQKVDDPPGQEARLKGPYETDNADAVPVNQRSPRHWSGHTLFVDGTNPSRLLPSQKGRKAFMIMVPSGAAAGVYIDEQDSVLQATGGPLGFLVAVGASATVATEGQVYAVSATAGTDTTVCVIASWG